MVDAGESRGITVADATALPLKDVVRAHPQLVLTKAEWDAVRDEPAPRPRARATRRPRQTRRGGAASARAAARAAGEGARARVFAGGAGSRAAHTRGTARPTRADHSQLEQTAPAIDWPTATTAASAAKRDEPTRSMPDHRLISAAGHDTTAGLIRVVVNPGGDRLSRFVVGSDRDGCGAPCSILNTNRIIWRIKRSTRRGQSSGQSGSAACGGARLKHARGRGGAGGTSPARPRPLAFRSAASANAVMLTPSAGFAVVALAVKSHAGGASGSSQLPSSSHASRTPHVITSNCSSVVFGRGLSARSPRRRRPPRSPGSRALAAPPGAAPPFSMSSRSFACAARLLELLRNRRASSSAERRGVAGDSGRRGTFALVGVGAPSRPPGVARKWEEKSAASTRRRAPRPSRPPTSGDEPRSFGVAFRRRHLGVHLAQAPFMMTPHAVVSFVV